ncbi:MAG: DUF4405 domain-containing protein [Phyllobacteriaceae bacterium]|nr:DUF4405 domain-containing protein [Phyllobacteriaceae bacterium]
MFRDLVNRYATPFVTGLFVISFVSGLSLFFHVGTAAFRGMHEWLSLVLAVPFVLHVWKNWLPLMSYLKRGWLVWPLGVCLVAGLAFAVPGMVEVGGIGGNPQMAMYRAMGDARIADLAPVLKVTPEELDRRLARVGLTGVDHATSLAAAAKAAGMEERHVIFSVILPH